MAAGFFELDDAPDDHPVRQQLLAMEELWRELLKQVVHEAVQTSELRADVDAEQSFGRCVGSSYHVSYRFLRNPPAFERALRASDCLVQRLRP